ncbi:hypothetical protein QR685DRAFT_568242 [Neurospora intermedia]|uniref:Uncharacterized protein n=1 Tax=Neurospora intermedia TaxID=5142 RepID=A0ABR3DS19_NEUIN
MINAPSIDGRAWCYARNRAPRLRCPKRYQGVIRGRAAHAETPTEMASNDRSQPHFAEQVRPCRASGRPH